MKKCSWILGAIFAGLISLSGCNDKENMKQNIYGFTVENWKAKLAGFPIEDSYIFKEIKIKEEDSLISGGVYNSQEDNRIIACVVDGITRDFLDGNIVESNLGSLVKSWKGEYPKYAQDVSKICTDNFLRTKSFEKANEAIGKYNTQNGLIPTDYLAKDLAGCTAAGFSEEGYILQWQFICDSGVSIVDKYGNLKFKTPDEGPHSKEKNPYLEEILNQHGGFANPEGRALIRNQYRNNPNEQFAYGALTGEEAANSYIRKGKERLEDGDFVLLYTDGVGEIIFPNEKINADFVKVLLLGNRKKVKTFCQKRISNEGTLVVYQKPDHLKKLLSERYTEKLRLRVEEDFFGPLGPNGTYLGR